MARCCGVNKHRVMLSLHAVQVSLTPNLCATAVTEGLREPTELPGAVPVWRDRPGVIIGPYHLQLPTPVRCFLY